MIRELVQAGFRLSGGRDKRLVRGLCWAAAEGVFVAAPGGVLYLLLHDVFAKNLTAGRVVGYGLLMFACLVLRVVAGRVGMPLVFSGAYAMMGEARLRIADRLRKLPLGWFSKQRGGDLGARLTSDLELVEHLWSHFLGVFVAGLAARPSSCASCSGWTGGWRRCFWRGYRWRCSRSLGGNVSLRALARG